MPDITMCANSECKKRFKCYRSPASGTQGSDYQSYSMFAPDDKGECKDFWDRSER